MSATAQNVPTNGFSGVPQAGAPSVPSVPSQPTAQGGFPAVPPAGDPPRLPGNGQPIVMQGQVPGMLPAGQQQPNQQPQQPAQQPQQQQAPQGDLSGLIAQLQAVLATGQSGAQVPQQAAPGEATRPDWLGVSANKYDITKIEDPIIRSMASVLQVAGKDLDLDRVVGKALAFGDASLIDMAYLAEKGGAAAPQIAEIAKSIVQAVNAKSNAITNEVYTLAGGEANWQTCVAAFNKQAPQELRAVVSQMIDSTNENHIRAGAKLVTEFGRTSGLIPQQGAPLLDGSASAGVQGQGLSKEQFQAELRKLDPNSSGFVPAREALFARRALGKRSGL